MKNAQRIKGHKYSAVEDSEEAIKTEDNEAHYRRDLENHYRREDEKRGFKYDRG